MLVMVLANILGLRCGADLVFVDAHAGHRCGCHRHAVTNRCDCRDFCLVCVDPCLLELCTCLGGFVDIGVRAPNVHVNTTPNASFVPKPGVMPLLCQSLG